MTHTKSFHSNSFTASVREENFLIAVSTALLLLAAASFIVSMIVSVI